MDYAALFEAVKGYVENDFPDTSWVDSTGSGTATFTSVEQLNTFIRQAEQRIYNTVELLVTRETISSALTAGNPYLTVPPDWLATISFAVADVDGRYEFLVDKDSNFIRSSYPDPAYEGFPVHYASFNEEEFLIGPTPDSDYIYELRYYRYPESIVSAGTSWLGDNFDTVLLYGTLLEAYTFMKGEPDVIELYQMRYFEALAQLKELAEGKNRKDAYRSGQPRFTMG